LNEQLAIKLFKAGAIFGEFEFKLHEIYPDAPKFFMKLNLRKPPDGNLTDELIAEIGALYVEIARRNNLKFDLLVGLPKAGDPLAEAFIINGGADSRQRIFLKKEDLGFGKRKILPEIFGKREKGNVVLCIDDVITLGGSKEEAIEAVLLNGLHITDCICLMDWGIGGKEILKEKYGVKLTTAFTVEDFLSIWQTNGLLAKEKCTAIIQRRDKIKEHIWQNQKNISSV